MVAHTCIGRLVERGGVYMGMVLTKRPKTVLFTSLFTAAVLASGIVTNFQMEARSTFLYTPQHAHLAQLRDDMWDTFGETPDPFIVIVSRADGGNVARKDVLLRLFALHDQIMQTHAAFTREEPGGMSTTLHVGLEDVCFRRYVHELERSVCGVSSVLQLWLYDREALEGDSEQEVVRKITEAHKNHEVDLGGAQELDDGRVVAGAYVLMYYLSKQNSNYDNGMTLTWEKVVWDSILANPPDTMRVTSPSDDEPPQPPRKHNDDMDDAIKRTARAAARAGAAAGAEAAKGPLRVTVYSRHINELEAQAFVQDDSYLIGLAVVAVIIYVCVSLSIGTQGELGSGGGVLGLMGRVALGLTSGGSVALSLLSGFGLACYLGTPLTPVSPLVVFTLLGVSVDDMIIIYDFCMREMSEMEAEEWRKLEESNDEPALKNPTPRAHPNHTLTGRPTTGASVAPDELGNLPKPFPVPTKDAVDAAFARACGNSASAITITSATTLVALATGASVDYPVYAFFCKSTMCCIAAVYFFQITFFAPLLLLHLQLQRKRLVKAAKKAAMEMHLAKQRQARADSAAKEKKQDKAKDKKERDLAESDGPARFALPQVVARGLPQTSGYTPYMRPALGGRAHTHTGHHGHGAMQPPAPLFSLGDRAHLSDESDRHSATSTLGSRMPTPFEPVYEEEEGDELMITSHAQLVMRRYARWVLQPHVAKNCLAAFAGLVLVALIAAQWLEVGLPQRDTVPDGSHVGDFLDDLDRFWAGDTPEQISLVFKCERVTAYTNASAADGPESPAVSVGRSQEALAAIIATGDILRVTTNWVPDFDKWLKCPPDVSEVLPEADGSEKCSLGNISAFLTDGEQHACEDPALHADYEVALEAWRESKAKKSGGSSSSSSSSSTDAHAGRERRHGRGLATKKPSTCENDEHHFQQLSHGHACDEAIEHCFQGAGWHVVQRLCPETCGLCTGEDGQPARPPVIGFANGGLDAATDVVLEDLEHACACSIVDESMNDPGETPCNPGGWWQHGVLGGLGRMFARKEHQRRTKEWFVAETESAHTMAKGGVPPRPLVEKAAVPPAAVEKRTRRTAAYYAPPPPNSPPPSPPPETTGDDHDPLLPPTHHEGRTCDAGVIASHRIVVSARMPQKHAEAYEQWETFKEAIKKAGARGYAYHPKYEFGYVDHMMLSFALGNLAMATAAIFLLLLCFLSPTVAAISTLAVCGIDVLLFGMMVCASVKLNSITLISLLIALALAIDYSCHLGHAYEVAPGATRVDKTAHALETMGASILSAGMSTLLGTLFLSLSRSAVFRTFFVLVWGTILWGLVCGLVVVPCMLSFVGPISAEALGSDTSSDEDEDEGSDTGGGPAGAAASAHAAESGQGAPAMATGDVSQKNGKPALGGRRSTSNSAAAGPASHPPSQPPQRTATPEEAGRPSTGSDADFKTPPARLLSSPSAQRLHELLY